MSVTILISYKLFEMRIKCGINAKSSKQSTQYTVNTYTIQLIVVWLERSGRLTKTLKQDSYARRLGNQMHIIVFRLCAFKQLSRHLGRVRW